MPPQVMYWWMHEARDRLLGIDTATESAFEKPRIFLAWVHQQKIVTCSVKIGAVTQIFFWSARQPPVSYIGAIEKLRTNRCEELRIVQQSFVIFVGLSVELDENWDCSWSRSHLVWCLIGAIVGFELWLQKDGWTIELRGLMRGDSAHTKKEGVPHEFRRKFRAWSEMALSPIFEYYTRLLFLV